MVEDLYLQESPSPQQYLTILSMGQTAPSKMRQPAPILGCPDPRLLPLSKVPTTYPCAAPPVPLKVTNRTGIVRASRDD